MEPRDFPQLYVKAACKKAADKETATFFFSTNCLLRYLPFKIRFICQPVLLLKKTLLGYLHFSTVEIGASACKLISFHLHCSMKQALFKITLCIMLPTSSGSLPDPPIFLQLTIFKQCWIKHLHGGFIKCYTWTVHRKSYIVIMQSICTTFQNYNMFFIGTDVAKIENSGLNTVCLYQQIKTNLQSQVLLKNINKT